MYYLDGQLPLPPPDGLPVVLGPFGGVHVPFPMRTPFINLFTIFKLFSIIINNVRKYQGKSMEINGNIMEIKI